MVDAIREVLPYVSSDGAEMALAARGSVESAVEWLLEHGTGEKKSAVTESPETLRTELAETDETRRAQMEADEAFARELAMADMRAEKAETENRKRTTRSKAQQEMEMAELRRDMAERWRQGKAPQGRSEERKGSYATAASLSGQSAEARDRLHQKWLQQESDTRKKRKVKTMADMDSLQQQQQQQQRDERGSEKKGFLRTLKDLHDPNAIGREALELTNKFRASHGLPPLRWNQAIADVGRGHSKDMADRKVPFGHDGFDGRVRRFPRPVRSAAENVAYNEGFSDVAKVAVDGWIKSPGHRKNMLSHFEECGIGVHNSGMRWYLTQLFAL